MDIELADELDQYDERPELMELSDDGPGGSGIGSALGSDDSLGWPGPHSSSSSAVFGPYRNTPACIDVAIIFSRPHD